MDLKQITNKVIEDSQEAIANLKSAPKHGTREYLRLWKKMRSRQIQPGYPVLSPLTKKEADEYVNKTVPECLLCGWTGKATANHISRIHGITLEEYRLAYELPLGFGIVSKKLKLLMRETAISRKNFIDGREKERESNRKKAHKAAKAAFNSRRCRNTYHSKSSAENLSAAPPKEKQYSDNDFLHCLILMTSNDMTISEVFGNFDVPQKTAFYEWTRRDPENLKKYIETVEGLSFAAQARGQLLGERFKAQAKIALAVYGTYRDAGIALGVNEMTIKRLVTM